MTRHYLKLNDRFFDAVVSGKKPFEIRKNDRGYQIGDTLVMTRTDDCGQPILNDVGLKDVCIKTVSYMLTHEDFPAGIPEGYVVMTTE